MHDEISPVILKNNCLKMMTDTKNKELFIEDDKHVYKETLERVWFISIS